MPKNIGIDIDELVQMRVKMRKLQKELDAKKVEFDEKAEALRLELEGQGMEKATGKLGTVSLSSAVIAHVQDWDKVYNYILRNKAFQLMHRRISDGAFRELVENRKGKNIPGIEPFTKKGINLRILS